MSVIHAWMRRAASERVRARVRLLGRLRWITKCRVIRRDRRGWIRAHPLRAAAYVLWDPEVDSFTYDVANVGELERCLATVLDRDVGEIRRVLAELDDEPELGQRFARDMRWRPWFKRTATLPAHHRSVWAITRILRPECVVETGILNGLGSRVMLAALARNAQDGHDGRLISFDLMPGAGAFVPERLVSRWTPVYEPTQTALGEQLRGRRVSLLTHDSDPSPEHQRMEFTAALAAAADDCVLLTVRDHAAALEPFADEHGLSYMRFQERSRNHFYEGRPIGFATRLTSAPYRASAAARTTDHAGLRE